MKDFFGGDSDKDREKGLNGFASKVFGKKSKKDKTNKKKRKNLREKLKESLRDVGQRAAALADYLVRTAKTLRDMRNKGSGFGKEPGKHEGYYHEEFGKFTTAIEGAETEARTVTAIATEAAGTLTTYANSKEEEQLPGKKVLKNTSAHEEFKRFDDQVEARYTTHSDAILPLILIPKGNLKKPKTDHSRSSFSKTLGYLLVGANLVLSYQEAAIDARIKQLEQQRTQVTYSSVIDSATLWKLWHPGPRFEVAPKNLKPVTKDPYEEQKKELELLKKSKKNAQELTEVGVDLLKPKSEGGGPRTAFRVDIKMETTELGREIRKQLNVSESHYFNFGGYYVDYT